MQQLSFSYCFMSDSVLRLNVNGCNAVLNDTLRITKELLVSLQNPISAILRRQTIQLLLSEGRCILINLQLIELKVCADDLTGASSIRNLTSEALQMPFSAARQ